MINSSLESVVFLNLTQTAYLVYILGAFSVLIVRALNGFPQRIIEAETIASFMRRLDKHLMMQEESVAVRLVLDCCYNEAQCGDWPPAS